MEIKGIISSLVDKAIAVWQSTLLYTLSPLYTVNREDFLKRQFEDKCEGIAPIGKFGKERTESVANRQIKHHTCFTVLLTFLSVIPQSKIVVMAFTIFDFIQTQVISFVLTEKLQYLYIRPDENDVSDTSLFDPQQGISTIKKFAIIIGGYITRQGLKYAAKIVVVRVFLLNILKQILKYTEIKAVSYADLDSTLEIAVCVVTAIVAGAVAWLLFYPMMVSYKNKLEKEAFFE